MTLKAYETLMAVQYCTFYLQTLTFNVTTVDKYKSGLLDGLMILTTKSKFPHNFVMIGYTVTPKKLSNLKIFTFGRIRSLIGVI